MSLISIYKHKIGKKVAYLAYYVFLSGPVPLVKMNVWNLKVS